MGYVGSKEDIKNKLSEYTKTKKVVFTNGCFDLLHVGHVRYLNEAKSLGDYLVVGVNSDSSVKKLKGPTRPVQNENDRAEILSNLKSVDFVVIFDEETPLNLIKFLQPNILVKGGDWKIEQIVGGKEVIEDGGQVFSLNFVDGKSTTNLINKSKNS